MLYFLSSFSELFQLLNVFKYITFRTGGAIITSLIISFIIGPFVIKWLKLKQGTGQPIRKLGPQTHLKKAGTPTMGGLMILVSIVISTLIWANLANPFIWITLFVILAFGAIGFVDDYFKLTKKNTDGLSAKIRIILQIAITGFAGVLYTCFSNSPETLFLSFPFFKSLAVNLGMFFVPFSMLVVIGSANAVNLTDGLDGLVSVPVMVASGCFAIIAYVVGHVTFAEYLNLNYIVGSGELAILCGSIVGASLGFLWFNAPPALVFMGDTGSLAIGAGLGMISVITKHEIVWAIIGGLFVLEAVSVIVQVLSFKLTGKRVFKMAPIHHHFEQKGWKEETVVIRFWIIAVILALLGLSTLKLR
ncbi:MAG: phospho-N-acetylmuramoyl-pentapeptide-transferase [Alphaproteobacteria bacterium]|jgi:phospho-N-acetylmuramoyl-pentapeptide-transferase|nr:phospho-N-acetylmuramoyl-pentapeptide-transferase [Alphaproteobacteria bacterium]MCV6599352.1 phospho-N-acetylmuramoyl-pentapeptide-transferase [Alphaproteobacteria bacterium]